MRDLAKRQLHPAGRLLRALGVRRAVLASQLGISKDTLDKKIAGRRSLTAADARRLLKALNDEAFLARWGRERRPITFEELFGQEVAAALRQVSAIREAVGVASLWSVRTRHGLAAGAASVRDVTSGALDKVLLAEMPEALHALREWRRR